MRENFPDLVGEPLTEEWWKSRVDQPEFRAKIAELRDLIAGPYTELYHLTEDPEELHDLSEERPDVVQRLEPLLEERRKMGRAARENAKWDTYVRPFDEETRANLEALGYGGVNEGK